MQERRKGREKRVERRVKRNTVFKPGPRNTHTQHTHTLIAYMLKADMGT